MGEGRFRLRCIWQASVLDPLKSMDESNEIDYLALKGERDAGMRRIFTSPSLFLFRTRRSQRGPRLRTPSLVPRP